MFFMPSDRNTCISSSLVREIFALGGDEPYFVPENVQQALDEMRRSGAAR
jgi:phosphopantetheine adenylyltransferase